MFKLSQLYELAEECRQSDSAKNGTAVIEDSTFQIYPVKCYDTLPLSTSRTKFLHSEDCPLDDSCEIVITADKKVTFIVANSNQDDEQAGSCIDHSQTTALSPIGDLAYRSCNFELFKFVSSMLIISSVKNGDIISI